jgi:hypothetical protein
MHIEQKARFLAESILVVIDPAQDSRHNVDVSAQRLQIAPRGGKAADDRIHIDVVGNAVISGPVAAGRI